MNDDETLKLRFRSLAFASCRSFSKIKRGLKLVSIKSGQKFKYLKNKKSFEDEIKSIFRHFYMAKQTFLEGERPTLKNLYVFFKEKVAEIECRENLKIKMLPGFKLLQTRKISLK